MAHAAAFLERDQKLVLQKRTVAGERIPARRVDRGQRREPFELDWHSCECARRRCERRA